MVLLSFSALAGDCDPALLDLALEASERAFLAAELPALQDAVQLAESSVCPSAKPEHHARLHRARGMIDLLEGDTQGARPHLRAANAAYPLLVAEGALSEHSGLSQAWFLAQEAPVVWLRAEPALVNGLQTSLRPDTPVNELVPRRNSHIPLIVGLACAAIGTGLYGTAFSTRGQYDSAVLARDGVKIRKHKASTNGLTVVGLGLIGAGGVLTVVDLAL